MLISSFVTRPDVYARASDDGLHILVDLDRTNNVSMTLSRAEAMELRDALDAVLLQPQREAA